MPQLYHQQSLNLMHFQTKIGFHNHHLLVYLHHKCQKDLILTFCKLKIPSKSLVIAKTFDCFLSIISPSISSLASIIQLSPVIGGMANDSKKRIFSFDSIRSEERR